MCGWVYLFWAAVFVWEGGRGKEEEEGRKAASEALFEVVMKRLEGGSIILFWLCLSVCDFGRV